jgi:hypothetical protein
MRPRKRILLAGDDADDIGVMAFVLDCNQYRVDRWLPHSSKPTTRFDAAILFCSGDPTVDQKRARTLQTLAVEHVLAMTIDGHQAPMGTDSSMRSTVQIAELLEHIRVIASRKRGPKKGYKPTISTLSTGFIHKPENTVEKGA